MARIVSAIFAVLLLSCSKKNSSVEMPPPNAIIKESWGEVEGKPVYLFTLTNAGNAQVKVTNYGCIITSWSVPDKLGAFSDIVLGYDSLGDYLKPNPHFGAVVGRYANRIADGSFELDGRTYVLVKNNGPNHLHGGLIGFGKKVWDATIDPEIPNSIVLTYRSVDMEEGYPGNLDITVRYTFTDDNALRIDYRAQTDKPTVLNLTNHSYFNLSGDPAKKVEAHLLQINANQYTASVDLIPTGEFTDVAGTPYDFREPHPIGGRLDHPYDLNLCINGGGDSLVLAATVIDPASGRTLECLTTQPGVQLYTGYKNQSAFCLETQHYPDSPHQPSFPPTELRPGEVFESTTIYRTSVVE